MSGEPPPTPGSPTRYPHDAEDLPDAPPVPSHQPLHSNDIPHPSEYEDSVMHAVLNPPPQDGLRASDASPAQLPDIRPEELPLPLNDPRRRFQSDVPGIRLTHPGGRYEGGPATENEDEKAADGEYRSRFIREYEVKTKEDLVRTVAAEKATEMATLVQIMRSRFEMSQERERVMRELQALEDQRQVELKAQRSIVEKQKAKKAEKEERKAKKARRTDDEMAY
ncbi:hypothetical protein K490DRAFT_61396 [Saccharata proteae CBS 121410]|uniref:Uncharacterized protein n=1 Tax=Saccharata proteae CBS 121410 TaxID=1314787 RepID=A0A9P4I1R0_9PEZI|nr:hypothetical protein K490DRAFT_61396 [Saccharata proteae CBS 121410]